MRLFKSFKEWRKYFLSSIAGIFIGLLKILWSMIGGIASYAIYIYKSFLAYAQREFKAAFITGVIIVILGILCMFVFVKERSQRVRAEYERDSLYLKLESMEQSTPIENPYIQSYSDITE